jgi:hypothetical protein
MAFSLIASDWKLYGCSEGKKDTLYCNYYDISSIDTIENGNIKIWIKALQLPNGKKNNIEISNQTVDKISKGYIPPFAIVNKLKEYNNIITLETLANSRVNAKSQMLFEVDVTHKKMRMLSITLFNNKGEIKSKNTNEQKWDYISPDSQMEMLYRLLKMNTNSIENQK